MNLIERTPRLVEIFQNSTKAHWGKDKITYNRPFSIVTFTLLKDDQSIYPGTNRRTEMVYTRVYSSSLLINANYVNLIPNATILQVMGRNMKNEGKPVFVIDTHESFVHARYRDFEAEKVQNREVMVRQRICPISSLPFNHFEVFYSPNGYVALMINDDKVFERRAQTYWEQQPQLRISCGIYETKRNPLDQTLTMQELTIKPFI